MLLYRVGFWVGAITFQWLIARATDSSPLMLGLLGFFNLAPMVVFTPFGGVLADRLDRRKLMVTTQLSMAAVAGLLTLLTVIGRADSVLMLFSFAFVLGVVLSFNTPANQAAVANSVPDEDLGSAISLNAIGLNLARIGGPAVVGPLLLVAGAGSQLRPMGAGERGSSGRDRYDHVQTIRAGSRLIWVTAPNLSGVRARP